MLALTLVRPMSPLAAIRLQRHVPENCLLQKSPPLAFKTDFLSGITVALSLVPEAITFALIAHVSPLTGLYAAFFICPITAIAMAIIYLLPKLTTAIPSALAAILIVAGIVAGAGIETKTVGDMGSIGGGLPVFHVPQVPFTLETFYIIAPYSLILAAIGLIESLLTAFPPAPAVAPQPPSLSGYPPPARPLIYVLL